MSRPIRRTRQGAIAALAVTAAAGLTLSGIPQSTASPALTKSSAAPSVFATGQGQHERQGFYDARTGTTKAMYAATGKLYARDGKAIQSLKSALGQQGMVDIDPATGTVSNVGTLDGYLTGASTGSPTSVALGYVQAHLAALGLTSADLSTLRLRQDYVDVLGTHHISWEQIRAGIPVFGNGLKANVTKRGQLISIQGSPVSGLTSDKVSASPSLSAAQARAGAVRDVGGSAASASVSKTSASASAWSNGDRAQLVWFAAQGGLRLGWATITTSGDSLSYSHVIDATTGSVLYRRDLVDFEHGDALVYTNYPGARRGGKQETVNLVKHGYLGRHQTWLHGKYVSAFADLNDNNRVDQNERTPVPGTKRHSQFTLKRFHPRYQFCKTYICTWNPKNAYSWRTNKRQDVAQAFFLASNFHNYLARKPIGFTAKAGNFQRSGGDPVLLNALDGANTDHGLPDGNHIDNANMATPPDGTPPTMQMYLWNAPGAGNLDLFLPTSGADDASILYHEYTHGLSNRLVVDATGNSTLNDIQARSMGEAWSDYYAMDYLVNKGLVPDTNVRDGQIIEGRYVAHGLSSSARNMAMDCDPKSTVKHCTDVFGLHGYTYGDFGTLPGGPEVHASGEIWGQTLWDLREKLGHHVADMLITRAMELSPADPSFLDMRNALLQADTVAYNDDNHGKLWKIFAHRGMGWFAGTINAGDTQPGQDFHVPPRPEIPVATLAGFVYDPSTGSVLKNALVSITGHSSGYIGDYTARTNSQGIYIINDVLPGTYKKVVASAPGYELGVSKVRVARNASHFTQVNFPIRRDWAAGSGGGSIADFNGPDYTAFGCGPTGAIDVSQGTGWGSSTGDDAATPTNTPIPKHIVIQLPRAIDIKAGKGSSGTAFVVDPSRTCGDPGSSSTNKYRIDVSRNGSTWINAATGSFGTIDQPDTYGHYVNVASTKNVTGVNYVRFTMVSPQVPSIKTNCPDGAFGGCQFMDMTEIEVFGTPAS